MKDITMTEEIQNRLEPGDISITGFMGDDPRDPREIVDEDTRRVELINLHHRDIAGRMTEFRDAGMEGMGKTVQVSPHFEVRVDSWKGHLVCPFADPGTFGKNTIFVKNTKLDREIHFTDLSIHLIEAHGFYQGVGSPYRLEPENLALVLEITQSE